MFAINRNQYLSQMYYEWDNQLREGLYHDTQILLAYNSNRMEGNPLTENDTRTIFESNPESSSNPDINAIINHFAAFNIVITDVDLPLTTDYIKYLHEVLMRNTSDAYLPNFILGDWRQCPAWLGAKPTADFRKIEEKMQELLDWYNNSEQSFEDINYFHGEFENIHPFANGNGRVGRLIHYKETVKNDITPCIVLDDEKKIYYYGIEMFKMNTQPLTDAFLYFQSKYENVIIDRLNTNVC